MTVAELIDLLKGCDPNAVVVATTKLAICLDDPDPEAFNNVHKITGLEVGYTAADLMDWDMSFVKKPVDYATTPTVRLLGLLDAEVRP